jgi:hypothetical protein
MTADQTSPISRRRTFTFAITTGFVGLVIGLAIIEVALRLAGYSSPEFYRADRALGYSLIPGISGWYSKEGRSYVEVNSDGFRDVERPYEKPADTIRIAIVGDSYVEGFQVGRDEMFSTFVLKGSRECGVFSGKNVEVLTFGVSGYGTGQELLVLREKVWRYSPDIVMLVMTTNNDVTDNLRELKNTPIPYFVLSDGKLTLDDSFQNERAFIVRDSLIGRSGTWFKNNLRFVQAIGQISVKLKYWYRNDRKREDRSTSVVNQTVMPADVEVGIDNQIYREPKDENWQRAWRVTESLLLAMRTDVEDRGAKFVVVTATNGVQILPSPDERRAYAAYLGVVDLQYPDRRIADFCYANSISVIGLVGELGDYSMKENANLHGFEGNLGYGHWNQLGHRIAGEAIARRLCEGAVR